MVVAVGDHAVVTKLKYNRSGAVRYDNWNVICSSVPEDSFLAEIFILELKLLCIVTFAVEGNGPCRSIY